MSEVCFFVLRCCTCSCKPATVSVAAPSPSHNYITGPSGLPSPPSQKQRLVFVVILPSHLRSLKYGYRNEPQAEVDRATEHPQLENQADNCHNASQTALVMSKEVSILLHKLRQPGQIGRSDDAAKMLLDSA